MPLPIGNVLGILVDNLRLRKSVLPLSRRQVTAWADGLNIPAGGETVLYTGHMYQLIPVIAAMAGQMAKFEDSWITRFFGIGRALNRYVNLSAFMGRADRREQEAYNGMLRNIAMLLRRAGVEFGYLYDKELYSGALVHDEGVDDVFREHARRVYRVFKESGVKRVITVDPHTTNMLRSVYPTVVDDYDLEVESYLEVLARLDPDAGGGLDVDVAIHDSCVYARHEGVVDEPRALLERAGARVHEAELSGRLTHCCGGPIESLFPAKAGEVAARRVEQLAACADNIVTMCPVCMVNLKHAAPAAVNIKDISEYLAQAASDGSGRPDGDGT